MKLTTGIFVSIIFSASFTIVTIGFLISINIYGAHFFATNFGDYAVAFGTLLLGLCTAYLGLVTTKEGNNERRRLRLKEQLEGLYSPAMAWIDKFAITDEHFTKSEIQKVNTSYGMENSTYTWKLVQDIRSKYEFLAEPVLKEQLRQYYNSREKPPYDDKDSQIYQKEFLFRELLIKIQSTIKCDFKKLSDEYSKLVNMNKK